MAYNMKCPMCNTVQDVGLIKQQDTGRLKCSSCAGTRFFAGWIHHTHAGPGLVANALPANAYVLWGEKTKEGFGPGLLRGMMEEESMMRPGAVAQPGGTDYAALPGGAGSSAVNIYIAKDQVMLNGQFYAAPFNAAGAAAGLTLLLLNGSGASIGHYMTAVVTGYQGWGASVLAVDYRGVGLSGGSGTAHGLYMDAEAMLRYLTDNPVRGGKGIAPHHVVAHGYSIGSAPATELARNHCGTDPLRLGALVLHCPIASFGSAAAFKQPAGTPAAMKYVVKKVASWGVGFNNKKKMLHIDLPVHIIYARGDTYVDPADARAIAGVQRAGPATTIQADANGDHPNVGNIFINANNTAVNDPVAPTSGTLSAFLTGLPR